MDLETSVLIGIIVFAIVWVVWRVKCLKDLDDEHF